MQRRRFGSEFKIKAVHHLIDAGARRDTGDRDGRTPLDHARSRGHAPMVNLPKGG